MRKQAPMRKSYTTQTKLVLPGDTNPHHSIFGGRVLFYIDEIASIASMKHSGGQIVTASIDSVDFISPVLMGEVMELEAMVTYTGRTSMEVYVRVTSRNISTLESRLTTESFVTTVAIDEDGKPREVPAVFPETQRERELYNTAPLRKENRKHRQSIKC